MRDSPMDGSIDQNDVILNRLNLQLARSRSILSSWTTQPAATEDEEVEDDADFAPTSERSGIGSKAQNQDDELLGGLRKGKSAQKERLLEQLIGKKAANAKRKEDASHKSMSASRHAAPKPIEHVQKQAKPREESDDEEEGRAAAFRPKKAAHVRRPPEATAGDNVVAEEDDPIPELPESKLNAGVSDAEVPAVTAPSIDDRSKKRKGGSYLDEILSQKAKKKKSKKKP